MEQIRQREVQPWRLVILGDGEERENLEEFISGYQIDGVTLAGFRQIEELPIYYGLANAFIHPVCKSNGDLLLMKLWLAVYLYLFQKNVDVHMI